MFMGVGIFNQHLIFMMDVVNMDTSPTSGDVLKSCAFYQSLCIHTSFYAPITNLLGVTIIFEYFSWS
jgi:hypothetical protein